MRTRTRSAHVAQLAERQWGVICRQQLLGCGLDGPTISRWTAAGKLHRIHRGVYAVGHRTLGIRARLVAALLYAAPGAALSHQTAAWWWGLHATAPRRIHVSTTGSRRSTRDVRVHQPRRLERTLHGGLPVTTVARTLLDCAATMSFDDVRRAVAPADFRDLLDPTAVDAELGRGRPGAARLRRALSSHLPELAQTRSVLEERFLALVEGSGLPNPEVNPRVEGLMVDALWREERVIAELDGHDAHDRPAATERDRDRDLRLRAAGYIVLRYTWQQVTREAGRVVDDLRRNLLGR